MFGIRTVTLIEIKLFNGDCVTHEVDPDCLQVIDKEMQMNSGGMLKIKSMAGDGFVRYPVSSIISVTDRKSEDRSKARVYLMQDPDGALYLGDPEERGARPLKTPYGKFYEDGYNLLEGDISLDDVCGEDRRDDRDLDIIAFYSTRVFATPDFGKAGEQALAYLQGADLTRTS